MSEQNKIDEIKAYVELCEEEGYKFQHLDNLKYLLQEIERKDEALRFYADEDNYFYPGMRDKTDVEVDCGQRAREAL
ncbi:hypothetical protein [Paenibacillus sp. DMB20]|uniref:hypothetical protein n=1 Tax=Paenibacillus sp. DMB20 TaxID=1642570 RepID=UPI00062785AC|nr:hypothetical protein [Paenibacillus sp. DMB20]KKO51119.1 hypothetical protein XI25_29475 [Paenibacillus sp. DMB20]